MLIGEMLLEEGIITREQLKDALEEQRKTGEKIGQILMKMGYISKEILWTFLGYQMGVPYVNLEEIQEIKKDVLKLMPESVMRNEKLIPINKQGKTITVAMSDPMNFLVIDDMKATTRCDIDSRLAPSEDIKKLVDKYFGFKEEDTGEIAKAKTDELEDIMSTPTQGLSGRHKETPQEIKITRGVYAEDLVPKQDKPEHAAQQPVSKAPEPGKPTPAQQKQEPEFISEKPSKPAQEYKLPETQFAQAAISQDTPVNSFLMSLLSDAYDANATDVHIEPFAEKCRVRRRIDGTLYEVETAPKTLYNGILNKIKELAQMNVAERTLPQESKLKMRLAGKEISMGVYTFPTIFGEKILLRILRAENTIMPLNEAGMEETLLNAFRKYLKMPSGLILIAGPTNSGKTTTFYSSLSEINTAHINIFTVEDASSNYVLQGVNQTKVNRKSYGQAVTYLAEQDCDVIAVGDIANKETAEAVFEAIAGGHLVISKVRAADPFQALQTIISLGLEPYVVLSNTLVVLGQRLLRKIDKNCKAPYEPSGDIINVLQAEGFSNKKPVFYKGKGCSNCTNTGYKGRTAVFEMIAINEKIKEMLINKEATKKIREENKKNGFKSLKETAFDKLIEGTTTIEEYMKIS